MIKGTIKVNSNTKNHFSALQAMKYEVTSGPTHITVSGSEFLATLDLSQGAGPLLEVVKAKQLLTYGTKITFEGGKTLSSVPMCLALGAFCKKAGIPHNLSCLVVKSEAKQGEAPATPATVAEGWEEFI